MKSQGLSRSNYEHYVKLSVDYLNQARKYVGEGKSEKASEVLWGALTAAINAYALKSKGKILKEHRELKDFIKQLSIELRDAEIYRAFSDAESFHANFYHNFLDLDDVRIKAPKAEFLIKKLLSL